MKKKNPTDLTALVNMMKVVFPTREDIREIIKEEIKFLPTKDDFYTRMDVLSKEIKDAREELAAHSMSHDRLTEKDEELDTRVAALEKKAGIRKSLLTSVS